MSKITPAFIAEMIDLACEIQQVPAPTFEEEKRAQFLLSRFKSAGLSDIHLDDAGNVWSRLPGGDARPLILCAHMDTVLPLSLPLTLERTAQRITGHGIGDNSLSLAALVALTQIIRQRDTNLPGDLWLVGTVCEEGLGNLKGIQAVVDRLSGTPLAYLILEGMGLGQVFHRALGIERYRITIQTRGGHSWQNYGNPSAIVEMAHLIQDLTKIPYLRRSKTILNVGTIQGGTTINSIAAQAQIEVDLRSVNPEDLKKLAKRVTNLAKLQEKPGIQTLVESIGHRPAGEIPADHPLVNLVKDCLNELDIQPTLNIASTEANLPLSRGLPAVCIGLTTGGNPHTAQEFIETQPLTQGMEQLIRVVERAWKYLTPSA